MNCFVFVPYINNVIIICNGFLLWKMLIGHCKYLLGINNNNAHKVQNT